MLAFNFHFSTSLSTVMVGVFADIIITAAIRPVESLSATSLANESVVDWRASSVDETIEIPSKYGGNIEISLYAGVTNVESSLTDLLDAKIPEKQSIISRLFFAGVESRRPNAVYASKGVLKYPPEGTMGRFAAAVFVSWK